MKLQSIQALRGLAALLVVFFHIRSLELTSIASNGLTERAWTGGVFTNGYVGVDLFFVISGFIMVFVTRSATPGRAAAADFLFARATRIYPVWWAFAAFMAVYMIVVHGLSGMGQGWNEVSRGQPFVPYMLKSFFLQPQPAFPVLGVGWTLVHEMYFYIVFTAFMLLPRKWLPALLGLWGAMIVGGTLLGFASPYANTYRDLVFYPMTMEFILGGLAGYAITIGAQWRSGLVTLVATLWLLVAFCYQGLETRFTLEWGRVLWFGLPCALLVYGVGSLESQRRLAWLVPVVASFLVTVALYQMFGLDDASPDQARREATILAVTVGGMAMLAVLWFGWLLGQGAPDIVRRTMPVFQRILNIAAKLGDWSFSLYLCHMIVLSALRRAFDFAGRSDALAPVFRIGHPGPLDNLIFLAVGTAVSIVASWITYRIVERPCIILFGRLRIALFHHEPTGPQAEALRT